MAHGLYLLVLKTKSNISYFYSFKIPQNHKMKRPFLLVTVQLFILALGINPLLFAQKYETQLISKLSTEGGLSNNTIYSILQDRSGFIWIATEQGLNKFDGKNLTNFAVNSQHYSLTHNRTQTMLLAPDGNIWIGTSDGLNIYDYRTDSIVKVRTNSEPLKLVYNDITILALSADKNTIWLGTYGNGVNYFSWDTKDFSALTLPSLSNVPQPMNVMSLIEDDNNRLWIGTQANGLYLYDLKSKEIEHFQLPDNGRFVRKIYQDSFRRIWIGTSKGCYIYNETSSRLEQITYPKELISNSIGAIMEDRNGKLWLGTELFLMNFSARAFSLNEEFSYQTIDHGESITRLSCPSVNSLFADQENNIWIGTAWGGVNMLKGTTAKFLLFKHNPDQENSLPNSPITAIYSNESNNIYIATIGTDKVGLCSMNPETGKITEHPLNKLLPGYVYQSIFIDSDKNLWIGTYNQGLIKTKPNGSEYEQFRNNPSNSNSLPGNDVRSIFESRDHTIWIGTQNGLARYDKTKNQLSRVDPVNNRNIAIRSIKEDSNGALWLGTYGDGAIIYNPENNVVDTSPINNTSHIIHDIFINGKTVWMATNGEGLVSVDTDTKTVHYFNEAEGLASNYINSLLSDDAGNIWVGHTKGISKITPGTHEVVNFNSVDGVQSRGFSEHAALKLPNGSIVFAGFDGINIFNPLNVTKDDKCPSVVFTRLFVSNELVAPSTDKRSISPITENITLASHIDLKYNQTVFTIEFMGMNYNANPKIQYAYILEGSDKEWINIGTQNSVTFRNLRAGEYVFKVKASSPDVVWSDSNMATIAITVHAPIWATGWAYLLYYMLLFTLIYFIGMFIVIRIRTANNLKIERARREKDEELHQEKLQFFTNISHELRTPLTLIFGPLETMYSEEMDEEKKANIKIIIYNAKRLLAMVNQLLDFRKAERGQMKLKVQYANIVSTINDVIISFKDLKKQMAINIEFPQNEEKIMVWYDPEFISKSLINLISNAFKFTPQGGTITVLVTVATDVVGNQMLSISVTDTGKGILEKDLPYIFDRFYQGDEKRNQQQGTGIGLHLVKSLIELHHGTIEAESTPNIRTTFKITIPIDKNAYLDQETHNISDETYKQKLDVSGFIFDPEDEEIHQNEKKKRDNRKKILIVEDNADIRNYIKNTLDSKYAIEEAENGLIGWDLMNLHEFDLVISDLMMPEMDGIEMCKRMKTSVETDHIPIIMLTAKSDIENRIEGLSLGADSYITKPFHPEHLKVRVAKLIELRELLKERYSRKILLGELHSPQTETDSPEELFLQKAISTIMERMMESEFNGDALAAELNISRMGLHRKIKALTGQTTGEFIRNLRLKKAHDLLSVEGKNISEVCYEVGFNSPSYFTTCFTDVYKIAPSEYVRSLKK
jgi:signal transduction histidine kinase/ligand-binding sensor domain-containing protein/DNA-binding response OmpR family regulator